MQISDNPELFQPLVEENILAANAGEIINNKVWGETVSAASNLLNVSQSVLLAKIHRNLVLFVSLVSRSGEFKILCAGAGAHHNPECWGAAADQM